MATTQEIEAAAAAIANARGGRRGAPAITNVLTVLKGISRGKLYAEVMEDAMAALEAAELEREKSLSKLFGKETVL
jgi:hypothetical protein